MQPARSCSCIQTIVEDPGAAVGCSLHPDGQFTLPVGEVADEREADVERSARPRLVDAAFGSGSEISGARRWKFDIWQVASYAPVMQSTDDVFEFQPSIFFRAVRE